MGNNEVARVADASPDSSFIIDAGRGQSRRSENACADAERQPQADDDGRPRYLLGRESRVVPTRTPTTLLKMTDADESLVSNTGRRRDAEGAAGR